MKTHSMNYSGRSIVKCSTDKESKLMFQRVELSLPPLTCQPGTASSPGWRGLCFPCALCARWRWHQGGAAAPWGCAGNPARSQTNWHLLRQPMSQAAPLQNAPEWLHSHFSTMWKAFGAFAALKEMTKVSRTSSLFVFQQCFPGLWMCVGPFESSLL